MAGRERETCQGRSGKLRRPQVLTGKVLLLDEIRIMPSSGVVRDRGVSQRLRRETHHLGFSCLPGAVGTVKEIRGGLMTR